LREAEYELRLCGLKGLERPDRSAPRGVAALEELALGAIHWASAPASPRLPRVATSAFATSTSLAVLLRVEPGEENTFLTCGPDIDRPLEDLAVHPEADISLVARLDLAAQRDRLPPSVVRR